MTGTFTFTQGIKLFDTVDTSISASVSVGHTWTNSTTDTYTIGENIPAYNVGWLGSIPSTESVTGTVTASHERRLPGLLLQHHVHRTRIEQGQQPGPGLPVRPPRPAHEPGRDQHLLRDRTTAPTPLRTTTSSPAAPCPTSPSAPSSSTASPASPQLPGRPPRPGNAHVRPADGPSTWPTAVMIMSRATHPSSPCPRCASATTAASASQGSGEAGHLTMINVLGLSLLWCDLRRPETLIMTIPPGPAPTPSPTPTPGRRRSAAGGTDQSRRSRSTIRPCRPSVGARDDRSPGDPAGHGRPQRRGQQDER